MTRLALVGAAAPAPPTIDRHALKRAVGPTHRRWAARHTAAWPNAALLTPAVILAATLHALRAARLEIFELLATGHTMERDFCVGRLRDMHIVHNVVYDELCVG
jgi:hypothetical protein